MDSKTFYQIWAPPESIWSAWVKPVTFNIYFSKHEAELPLPDISAVQADPIDSAVIINLRGAEAVSWGLALMGRGFRPVPLFNAAFGANPLIDIRPIVSALYKGAEMVQRAPLPPDAPPAFLIDEDRSAGMAKPLYFDNRWVVFPQDVPSGTFLRTHGIRRVFLIQRRSDLQRDLAQVFALWRRAGLEFYTQAPNDIGLASVAVRPLGRFRIGRALAAAALIGSLGLRRNMAGGFGSRVPDSSGG